MLRSWWLGVEVLEKSSKECEDGYRRCVPTLGCRSFGGLLGQRAIRGRTGVCCTRHRRCHIARTAAGNVTLLRRRWAEMEGPLFGTRLTRHSDTHSSQRSSNVRHLTSSCGNGSLTEILVARPKIARWCELTPVRWHKLPPN